MGTLGSHSKVLRLLVYQQLQVIFVVNHGLHVFPHLIHFLFVLVVPFLVSGSLIFHLPHFSPVLTNSILSFFHCLLLFGYLLLGICELKVRLRVNLVFLVQLFIQILLVGIPLLINLN